MELLYFTDISQLQYVLDKKPLLLEQMQPITGDVVVACELERRNISFVDEWDFLGPTDIERNSGIANDLSGTWWHENLASTEYEGFSLLDAARQDMVYPLEACLNARTVYEKIFQKNHINRISGYFLPEIGVIRCGPFPTHRAVRSVSQAILFWLADKYGIQIDKLESKYPLSEGVIRKGRRFFGSVKIIASNKMDVKAAKVALVVSGGMDEAEYKTLKNIINDLLGWQSLAISQSDFLCNPLIKDEKNKNLELQSSWIGFCESVEQYQGHYPEIFANPHLKFQFQRIWDEIGLAVKCGNVFSTFLDVLQPSLIIFGHEAFTIERVLVRLAKKKGIHTVGLVHEGLGHKIGFRGGVGDADSLLVWSDIGFNALKSYGINEARLQKIGSIRYEPKLNKYLQKTRSNESEFKNRAKKRIGIPVNKSTILILTTAINTGFYTPIANPRKHRETINELITLIKSRQDLQFIIKPHRSYDYYELYRKLTELNLANLKLLESATLDEALEASDICLMINYFTTAGLEAMLSRVPVIYLNTAVYDLPEWNDILPGFVLNRIRSVSELENHIDSLLNDPAFKEGSFIEAEKLIKQVLDVKEKSAIARLLDFIQSISANSWIKQSDVKSVIQTICAEPHAKNINEELAGEFIKQHIVNQSFKNVLYVFSFLAGTYNLGVSNIYKIFNVIQSHFAQENKLSWSESNWAMFLAYISGYNLKVPGSDIPSAFKLGLFVLLHPKKFIFSNGTIKGGLMRYLTQAMTGKIIAR
ncbi:MAG: hypothetical protein NTX59_01175 [Elusimicrobia bacterium]|nr:hypothetical protein [Elusimicrobiota bacterium]